MTFRRSLDPFSMQEKCNSKFLTPIGVREYEILHTEYDLMVCDIMEYDVMVCCHRKGLVASLLARLWACLNLYLKGDGNLIGRCYVANLSIKDFSRLSITLEFRKGPR